ncbi:MAG: hypothetical protein IKA88_04110 [Clostridia bacterium]|nr:hypothetical protein [Clostridia bacterium]
MIYDIAGLRIKIENRCSYTENFCKAYLSKDQTSPTDLSVKVTVDEFRAEKEISGNFSDGYVENICLYRNICKQIPLLNRILLHAAVLEYDGNGYAFLGRSGTGKSTHTGLWLKHIPNVRIINGDKPILQATENGFLAYGTPWMGKEGLGCNASTPLKGLCFLEQAPENSIRRLIPSEVSARLFTQILLPQDEENVVATLELVDRLIMNTPAYLLRCNISEEAVQTSFEEMTGLNYQNIKKN